MQKLTSIQCMVGKGQSQAPVFASVTVTYSGPTPAFFRESINFLICLRTTPTRRHGLYQDEADSKRASGNFRDD